MNSSVWEAGEAGGSRGKKPGKPGQPGEEAGEAGAAGAAGGRSRGSWSKEAVLKKAVLAAVLAAAVGALATVALVLGGCAEDPQSDITSLDDIATARIAVIEGSIYDQLTEQLYPDAPKLYYKTSSDIIAALRSGKVDCLLANKVAADEIIRETGDLRHLDEYLGYEDLAPLISPYKEGLCEEINEVLAEMKEDGSLERLQQKWLYGPPEDAVMGSYELSGENGTLSLATSSDFVPFSFRGENGEIAGYDIEFMMIFASRRGYDLEITDIVLSGMLAAISVGKYDIAASGITITPERAKAVLFSDPIVQVPMVCMVRDASSASSLGPIDSLGKGMQATFVQEGRYRLMLSGLGVTLGLTALSAALGTALGLALFSMKRSRHRVPRLFAGIVDRLTGGLPAVVVLLILAYVAFASVPIGGFWVAAIGFSVIFASGFSETMLVGVGSVGGSQAEAALALGFKRGEAFRLVVLPQAMRTIARLYGGQLAELLKGTAIVGYIAVDDLTRTSDLVRSVTFEAFVPLVSSALVYLLVIWLLVAALRAVERRTGAGRARRARAQVEALRQEATNRAGAAGAAGAQGAGGGP